MHNSTGQVNERSRHNGWRWCVTAYLFVSISLIPAVSVSQNVTDAEADSSISVAAATRLIPLYYCRDMEKVLDMVREPARSPAVSRHSEGLKQHADFDAIDRVRITVMGEGLLHLRGPLEGVNAITRMIHEIDQPVGQVKLGIHVVQFTVSDNTVIEGVNGAVDQYLSYARQMSKTSQLLFRTALGNVAARYQASYPERFAEAFFYKPCVENFCIVNGNRTSISVAMLDAGNIVTTLFLIGLANQDARREILVEFRRLAAAELPRLHHEYQNLIATDQGTAAGPRSLLTRLYGAKRGADSTSIAKARALDHQFIQTMAFLESFGEQSNSVNPIQIATARFQRAKLACRHGEAEVEAMRDDRMLMKLASSKSGSLLRAQIVPGDIMDVVSFGRLADHVIEEQAARVLDLQEAAREEAAALDGQLKRLTEAFEEDLRVQFYKPVLEDLRRNSGTWKSRMGQIQSTTILTYDRTLARVSPGQVAVLDRPVRPVLIQEGLQVAQGVTQDAQALAQGGATVAISNAVAPGSAAFLTQTGLVPAPGQNVGALAGASEQITVAAGDDIAVTPVIQPDGFSVAFHLAYTHAPKRDDTASTGGSEGVQRHHVEANVNIPSLALQEVSRFRIALNTLEQGNGVPLLEDIPGLGVMFRQRRVAASMTQENIILVGAVVYPSSLEIAGKSWLACDPAEPDENADTKPTSPISRDGRGELVGWVVQALRRQAHASLGEERFPQRLAAPSAPASNTIQASMTQTLLP